MSGGVSATTTGPNATQQMNASHSARNFLLASRMASYYTRLACSRHCETTFQRERSRCSAIRNSAAQNAPFVTTNRNQLIERGTEIAVNERAIPPRCQQWRA